MKGSRVSHLMTVIIVIMVITKDSDMTYLASSHSWVSSLR